MWQLNYKNILFSTLLFCASKSSSGAEIEKKEANYLTTTLKSNQMKVILEKNTQSPAVMHMVVYSVGGLHDYHGRAGLAHFFEHLMFRSTKNYAAGVSTKFLDEIGASQNASTHYEFTNYHQLADKTHLDRLMDFESDRMKNLQMQDDEVEKERNIIKEERRMRVESGIEGKFFENLIGTHYNNEYYGRPIIGSMQDIDSIKKVDLWDFYKRFYNPKNATLIVVGNIEFEPTLELVEKYYGSIKNTDSESVFDAPKITEQSGISTSNRFFSIESDEVHGSADIYYMISAPTLISGLTEKESAAFYLLDKLISKYLQDLLVDDLNIASSVGAGSHQFAFANSPYIIVASTKPGPDQERDSELIRGKIEELIFEGKILEKFNEKDILSLKNQSKAEFIYLMDEIDERASVLAQLASIGYGPEFVTKFPELIEQIEQSDIIGAFEKIMKGKYHTIGVLKAPIKKKLDETSEVIA